MNKKILIAGVIGLLGLVGCGQKDVSSEVIVSENGVETKVAYIKREPLQPIEKYIPLDNTRRYVIGSPEHLKLMESYRNLYWSSAKIDYELLAYDFIDGYADEEDAFKKKDLIKANKEKLDDIYKNLPKDKYFAVRRNDLIELNKYSDKDKGFLVPFWGKEGLNEDTLIKIAEKADSKNPYGRDASKQFYYTMNIVGVMNTETSEWKKQRTFVYIPKSEDEARLIEAELSAPAAEENIDQILLGRSVGTRLTGDSAYASIFMVDGIALVNHKSGKVIFTISQKELGDKYQIQCDFIAKSLGYDDIKTNKENCNS